MRPPSASSRPDWSARLARAGLAAAALLALPFVLHAVVQGLDGFGRTQRWPTRFFDAAAPGVTAVMMAHMVVGGLVTALAFVQLSGGLRRRWPALHRASGRLLVAGALVTALGGLVQIAAAGTIGGPWMSAGFALYGLCLGAAALLTWRAAVRADRRAHYRWGLRTIWLALGSWLFRVGYGLWEIATGGAGSTPTLDGPFDRVMVLAFFVVPLALLEPWLRRPAAPY